MGQFETVTDEALARARRDPAFKQQLLTANLNRLLAVLYRQQQKLAEPDATVSPLQLREGAMLATRLADLIRRIDDERTVAAKRVAAVDRLAAANGK